MRRGYAGGFSSCIASFYVAASIKMAVKLAWFGKNLYLCIAFQERPYGV